MGSSQSTTVTKQVKEIQSKTQEKINNVINEAIQQTIAQNTKSIKELKLSSLSELQKQRLATLPSEDVNAVLQAHQEMNKNLNELVKQVLKNPSIPLTVEAINEIPAPIAQQARKKIQALQKEAQIQASVLVDDAATSDVKPIIDDVQQKVQNATQVAMKLAKQAAKPGSISPQQHHQVAQMTSQAAETAKEAVDHASLVAATAAKIAVKEPTSQNIQKAKQAQELQKQAKELEKEAKKAQKITKTVAKTQKLQKKLQQ